MRASQQSYNPHKKREKKEQRCIQNSVLDVSHFDGGGGGDSSGNGTMSMIHLHFRAISIHERVALKKANTKTMIQINPITKTNGGEGGGLIS